MDVPTWVDAGTDGRVQWRQGTVDAGYSRGRVQSRQGTVKAGYSRGRVQYKGTDGAGTGGRRPRTWAVSASVDTGSDEWMHVHCRRFLMDARASQMDALLWMLALCRLPCTRLARRMHGRV
jgi:hypothetical protein